MRVWLKLLVLAFGALLVGFEAADVLAQATQTPAGAQSTSPGGTSGGGGQRALWIVFAFAVALVLFFIEALVPSGGILAIASALSAVVGIVLMFQINTTLGMVGIVVTLAALPFLIGFMLKLLPDTPIFRWMILSSANEYEEGAMPEASNDSVDEVTDGDIGVAETDLYPSGSVLIDGKRWDAVSIAGQISKGSDVRVVGRDAFGLKVAEVEAKERTSTMD